MSAATETATAAASGASATERFTTDKLAGVANTPKERVDLLAREVLDAVHETIRKHEVTYDEFNALKAWLIGVGRDGEWPLFLDVWVEHVVEEVANADREGSKGTIEGPYYVPGAPELGAEATMPMRDDEQGTPLLFQGQVTNLAGEPVPNAKVELWHADEAGFYSQFAPGIPEWNLRGTITADDEGRYWINTMQPAPYQIPTDGSCGKLIGAAGWHAWRPAHLHLKVSAPEHQLITTQLYFPGDPHNDDDIASAVKPELLLDIQPAESGNGNQTTYDFVLDPA
ncbi:MULTISPECIES: catechol 1,2-dioxygenase [unclassified Nocardioides]|uniref:catechol 1,2-dioxygenase n=1 Tax=unclassified Nocardioides TaxID=2615069 RepID=UPI0006F2E9D9|nr:MULTISPECIES: catechol 1,2-dioxygenase [unclassified Nocardioides]KQY56867.1 catechol 1,2-dioxygenase [Nocardioides sp. Root140]KQZ66937.1 catechol 1,2-dioxygenase [Nocardioides sp. Root151]KRF12989.1 catechol 1,2-dioxygenase [Nocardioides sp. Soil796]